MSRSLTPLVAAGLLASLLLGMGCAACPNGRCGRIADLERADFGPCEHCGSDGITPQGYPCQKCGPQLPYLLARWPGHRAFHNWLTCSTGCAEVYWDEWYNDPPADHDPCDDGTGCHPSCLVRFWETLKGDCCPSQRDDCCLDDEGPLEYYDAPPSVRTRRRVPEMPLDEELPPSRVRPESATPDHKAQLPRRVLRR